MPNNIKEERLRWVLPIQNKEAKLKEADDFVRDNFGKEEWFCEQALHGGS